MALKVYLSGDIVVVDKIGEPPVLNIPQSRAKYTFFGTQEVQFYDILFPTDIRQDLVVNIQDSSGTPIGDYQAVKEYLESFIFRGDSVFIPEDEPVNVTIEKNPDNLDAAGALTVAEKNILGNYVQDVDELPYLLSRRSGGTATQVWNDGRVAMTVNLNTEYAVSQSFQVHPYFAGKSQRIEITFDSMGVETDVIKKVGLFDSDRVAPYNTNYDGLYLEMDGNTYNLVIANADLGTEIKIPKGNWDNQEDTLDLSKFNVMAIDFLYLGGTSVRLFFKVQDKGFVLFHEYTHAGIQTGTIVQSPSLPVRWEIRSTGGAGIFGQICASVNSSGQQELIGTQLSTPVASNVVNANIINTTYMLKAIRFDSSKGLDKALLSLGASAMAITNDNLFLDIRINPSIAGPALVWNNLTDENGTVLGIQYADPDLGNPSASVVTGGMAIWSSFMGDRIRSLASGGIELNRKIGVDLDGVADILVLTVTPVQAGNNADVYGTLNPSIN